MKKIMVLLFVSMCFTGCSKPDYKRTALKFLKSKLTDKTAIDTVHFFKPDSISTSVIDDRGYLTLRYKRDSLLEINYPEEAAKFTALMNERIKSYKKKLTGWEVRLIYKTKDKQEVSKTDSCRFIFNIDRNSVRYATGSGIPPSGF